MSSPAYGDIAVAEFRAQGSACLAYNRDGVAGSLALRDWLDQTASSYPLVEILGT